MDKATAEKTLKDFLKRTGFDSLEVKDIEQAEKDAVDEDTIHFGWTLEDPISSRKIHMAFGLYDPPYRLRPGEKAHGFSAWFYQDVPQTRDSPPDCDVISLVESEHLYPVVLDVIKAFLQMRLDYAHQAFGEDDET